MLRGVGVGTWEEAKEKFPTGSLIAAMTQSHSTLTPTVSNSNARSAPQVTTEPMDLARPRTSAVEVTPLQTMFAAAVQNAIPQLAASISTGMRDREDTSKGFKICYLVYKD